ncbi:neuferricin-like [Watersipora subatra]|uniref:neuferricin-like n=1 Tax=Watersipora subatra TaxID=2589382 RepID=UPI00355BDE8F
MGTLSFTLSIAFVACIVMCSLQYSTEVSEVINHYLPSPVSLLLHNAWSSFGKALASFGIASLSSGNGNQGSSKSILTKDELQGFKHKYLAIVGEIFDVTKGKGSTYYEKEGHYNFFTGIDGTKAFVTGDFTENGLTDDITGLDPSGIRSLEDWRLMYHKEYKYIGKLIGRFYDANGKETEQMLKYKAMLKEGAAKKQAEEEIKKLYPPCNSEFKNQASRVWCSDRSGGIQRAWIGVPRKLFTGSSGEFRCACIRTTGPPSSNLDSTTHNNKGDLDNPNLREYDNCDPASHTCPL